VADKKVNISPASFTTFGELLRYLRTRAELTQRELALKVGYHYSHLNRFEKNQRTPDRATILSRFAPALEIQNENEWVERMLALGEAGSGAAMMSTEQAVSVQEVYRLPVNLTPLIGRQEESAQLKKILLQPDTRLVTLIGPPGVGKTHLSLHIADIASANFTNGAVFINLTPITESSLVLHAIGDALGLVESSTAPGIRTLKNFLQDKNLLIVMDNFEQVLAAAPQVSELLGAAPSIKILATSREAFRIQGEREFPLSPLPTSKEVNFDKLPDLNDFPAMQLFVQRAAAIQPGFELTAENASLVADICLRLDGLPLAIELAAARIQSLSLTDMLAQFDRLFDWLTRGRRDTPAWRQTLLGAIEWSYSLLSESERILFTRLAVFSGGWTLQAAESVCGDDENLNPGSILDLLSQLVDRSLVTTEISNGATRYRYLGTIFQFSLTKLKESSEWEVLRSRHLKYFSAWGEKLRNSLDEDPPLELRSRMDSEGNNIRAALEWGMQSVPDVEPALAMASSAGAIWLKHSHFKEALDWVTRYLAHADAHESQRVRLLFLAASLSYWRDNLPQAIEYGQEGIKLAQKIDDRHTQAGLLYYMGDIYREYGELELARQSVEASVALCREIDYVIRLSMALTSLGVILFQLGERAQAEIHISEALAIAVREKNLWCQSYALRVQADNLRIAGNFVDSFQAYERALSISSEIDDRISVGMEFANMSLVANVLEDYSASNYYGRKALSQFQAIGNEYQQPFPQRMLAYALAEQGELSQARAYCMESLKGNQAIDHKTGVVACLVCMANIVFREGNIASARNLVAFLKAEIAVSALNLMEPDQKTLEYLGRELEIVDSLEGNIPDLKKVLSELGL